MDKIKIYTYLLLALPALLAFSSQRGINRHKIIMDLERYEKVGNIKSGGPIWFRLYKALVCAKAFRSIYYMRVGHWAKVIKYFLPGEVTCNIASTKSAFVGGGVYIQHGWGMVLDAESVGENLWINQNVTVGYRGNGHPRIGNNVRIGTGAVVLGPITIGDNVNIGANAIVVEDVPSNCTICSPKATIVKYYNS